MYIHEAYTILEAENSTLKELLQAHEVVCIEKGYLLAIAIRNAESCAIAELEGKIWKLALCITGLELKIQEKFTPGQSNVNSSH